MEQLKLPFNEDEEMESKREEYDNYTNFELDADEEPLSFEKWKEEQTQSWKNSECLGLCRTGTDEERR